MKVSDVGLDLIKGFESLVLKAYPDPGSRDGAPWTLGYGHTDGVKPGDTCTEAEALEWLREDCSEAEGCINDLVEVDLSQCQFDALVSFVFNTGCAAFRNSTMLRLINGGNMTAAGQQFKRWDHNDGKVMAGLTRRRAAEAALFQEA